MNWKKLILYSLPLWVLYAGFVGVKPFLAGVYKEHLPHYEVQKMEPMPPQEVPMAAERAAEDSTTVVERPQSHIHQGLPEEVRHFVDRWIWVFEYLDTVFGVVLAGGQVLVLLHLRKDSKKA